MRPPAVAPPSAPIPAPFSLVDNGPPEQPDSAVISTTTIMSVANAFPVFIISPLIESPFEGLPIANENGLENYRSVPKTETCLISKSPPLLMTLNPSKGSS